MRRFENSGEDKFWQIEQRDMTLRVTFGKIGSKGQIQLHRCANDSEIKSETARLVADKVKKGFVEVREGEETATAAAPTPSPKASPTPAPAPARAPSPKASTQSGVDTSARLYQIAAPKAGTSQPFKPKPVSETFKRLHERYEKFASAIDAGIKKSHGKLLESVKAAYSGDAPDKLDLDTEAAAYRLMALPREYRDDNGGELFGRYWVAKEGGEFALRALAASGKISRHVDSPNAWSEPKLLSIEDKPHEETATWGKPDDVWVPIREWAASLDAAELAKARAVVAEARKDVPAAVRALVDAAIGDPEFCAEDVKDLTTAPAANGTLLAMWPALMSMTDVDAIIAVLDKGLGTTGIVDHLPVLVVTLGVASAPVLAKLLTSAVKGAGGAKEIGEVAALVHTPEIAEAFAKHLDVKELRAVGTEYLQNTPELAIAPLAHIAIGKGGVADIAKSVLGSVVQKAPDAAREIAASSAEAHRLVIERALERFDNLVDADESELPRVVAKPPWLEKKRAEAARVVRGLSTLAHKGRVVWEDEAQRTEFKNENSYYAPDPSKEKAVLKEIADAEKAKKASSIGSYKLMQLPKESAIRVLETAPLELFSWYYGNLPNAFIGRYELDALKAVLRYATIDPTNAVEALAVVDAAEVAPLMADAMMRLKKSRALAQAWLLRFPEAAAVGLVPIAVGDVNKARTGAEAALRYVATHGKREVVEKVAAKYGDEAKAAMASVLDFDPLLDFPAKLPKMPGFFNASALPRPRLRGQKKVLPTSALEALGTMLTFARIDEPYAGIAQVKEACEPSSLAEFAWELFQAWLVAGAPSKEQWAFLALGQFGDDECARKLTPLVRAWPGEAAHARAVIGLDVLATIGTDVALMHLHGIAQKLKFKGLQEKAREKIDQIAEARGLTAAELADRLVPDLGLDDDGSLSLDYGTRKFKVSFDEMLKPLALDESGKRLTDLPKPNKSDDAEKSAAAVATWKALKKDSKTVASSQLLRLELAMCSQRRWEPEAFDQFFVNHPLMIHLVRRLIWGSYDKKDKLVGTFRVSEDRTYADPKDAEYKLPAGTTIGLVHRLEMDQKDADAWGQVLGDYEIMQPFAQLSREVMKPTADEEKATELARIVGITVPTGKVLGLDNRGWRRGPPQDAGVVCWYEKPLAGDMLVCMDLDPGIYTGMISESPEQKLGKVVITKDGNSWRREGLMKLGDLSPIAFSGSRGISKA